jgi:uncharacterized membrane protein YesL
MEMRGWMGGIYRFCEWIMRLAYVNLLWIMFSIVGLVILGFFPATAAMFAVTRQWMMGREETPVFSTFWNNYRKEFWRSNLLGWLMVLFGYILYIDYRILAQMEGWWALSIQVVLLLITLFYTVVALNIVQVFVHYEVKVLQYLKFAFVIGFSYLHWSIFMGVGVFSLYFIFMTVPGLIPFFSGSALCFMMMWSSYHVFKRIQEKSEESEDDTDDGEEGAKGQNQNTVTEK